MDNSSKNIDQKARTIQEIANGLGWNLDVNKLIERVKQIDSGLISEDEFIYLMTWFGKCSLIHKLDQFKMPRASKSNFTIPDCLAVIKHKGIEKPFFIEIKTSKNRMLSWTETYYQGLVNYSNTNGIPILVAWKWSGLDIWTLFELKHFEKNITNYKIGIEKAHQENLMGELLGDYLVVPYEDIGLHFKLRKDSVISQQEDSTLWQTDCESIYVTGEERKELYHYQIDLWLYFFSMPMEQKKSETDSHIIVSFIPSPNRNVFAQSIPIRLMHSLVDMEINWLQKIKDQDFKANYETLYSSWEVSIEDRVIRNIFHVKPTTELL